jgi:hypothetical protein
MGEVTGMMQLSGLFERARRQPGESFVFAQTFSY